MSPNLEKNDKLYKIPLDSKTMLRYTGFIKQNIVTLGGGVLDLISKKELLAATGISYGQLYRWKREQLIPEAWFMKKSSFTGQETFFPREQILERIKIIVEYKDRYSLDELSRMLSPETSELLFTYKQLEQFQEIHGGLMPSIRECFGDSGYGFPQILFLTFLSWPVWDGRLSLEEGISLLEPSKDLAAEFEHTDITGTFFRSGKQLHILVTKDSKPLLFDSSVRIIASCPISDLANQLHIKYRELFSRTERKDES